MSKDRGYILLHRSIQNSEIWESDEPFTKRDAWIDLLLFAQHTEYKGVQRGCCRVSQVWLANRWKWSRNRVGRYLKQLTEQGMVTTHGAPNGTVVTIVNYDKFQNPRTANGATNGATKRTPNGATSGAHTKNVYTKNVSTNNEDTNTGSAENPPLIDTQYGRIYE